MQSFEVSEKPRRRLKVLLSAYACEPGRGSEEGIGWNTVLQMSRAHDVWVMVTEEFRAPIERFASQNPMPGVHWEFFNLPRWLVFWHKEHRFRRLHYHLWQIGAYRRAQALHDRFSFDIAHHITYGSYWRPSFLARLPIPYIWGPVGGAENVPFRFYGSLSTRGKVFDIQKNLTEQLTTRLDPLTRRTAQRAAVALVPTERTAHKVRRVGAPNIRMMPQIALPAAEIERLAQVPIRRDPTPFRVISLGRMISWKGLHLGLRAFARFASEYPDAEYWHSGDGPERERFMRLAQELGVADRVRVFTKQKRAEALEALAQSDVLLFPCLHDEPGWVVLEALAAGRPVVYLLGMPHTPDADQSGFTPRTDTAERAVEDMAAALLRLATDPDLRARMGEAGRAQVAAHFNWDTRGQEFLALYDEIAQAAAQGVSPS